MGPEGEVVSTVLRHAKGMLGVEERGIHTLWKTFYRNRTKILTWASTLMCATAAALAAAACLQLLPDLDFAAVFSRAVCEQYIQDGEVFEYIVVGGGAAGGAVAARLALANRRVLLLEAGGDPGLMTKVPASGGTLIGSNFDYYYETEPNNVSCLSSRGGACRFSRGRVLGGSTAINLMMYTRGHPTDYDYRLPGWTWPDFEPFFLRYEGLRDLHRLPESSTRYHNTSGAVPIGYFTDSGNPWQTRIVNGFHSLNVSYNPDLNAKSKIGVSKVLAFTAGGERVNTAEAYLRVPGVREKLRVAKNTRCLKIILDEKNTARGVVVSHQKEVYRLYARNEIVLTAGTIGSTQLLMVSGIGPADHLKQHNITVKADLPVGEGMTDHVAPLVYMKVNDTVKSYLTSIGSKVLEGLQWLVKREGPLATSGISDVTTFINTNCYDFKLKQLRHDRKECDRPTMQFIHAYINRGFTSVARPIYERVTYHVPEVTRQVVVENEQNNLIVVTLTVLQPHSLGRLRLASADPSQRLLIIPNYLHDERDVAEIVRAIRILEDLTQTPEYRKHNASLLKLGLAGCPGPREAGYWACYARHMTYSVHHAVGTAALGSVLDARLRVRRVQGLRVADAAALPRLPRANTAAAVLALAERAAHFILEDEARQ